MSTFDWCIIILLSLVIITSLSPLLFYDLGIFILSLNIQPRFLCKILVAWNTEALKYISEENQTKELCFYALSLKNADCSTISYIKKPTKGMYYRAVKQDGWALRYVKEQTLEICLAAVKQDGHTLGYVKNQTLELIEAALENNLHAVNYIDINILPVRNWSVEWFKYLWNTEFQRKFIKERGAEIFEQLDYEILEKNKEYTLVEYMLGNNLCKALIFRCPSSNDVYFQEVDPKIKTLKSALKFLNNGIKKEELAYES